MKKITSLKLNQLSKTDLEKREMNSLRGGIGECCGCGCHYVSNGGYSLGENGNANLQYGYTSYGGDLACFVPSENTFYSNC